MHTLFFILSHLLLVGISLLALTGWGVFTHKLLHSNKKITYLSSFTFLGLFSVAFLIKLIHFFSPINLVISLSIFLVGLLSIIFLNKAIFNEIVNSCIRFILKNKWQFFFLIFFIIYWCLRIMHPSSNYDTAAYHIQTIRWINEYPTIPGLGNLSPYYALNQSYFELLSLLRFFPYLLDGFVIGGLIFFSLIIIVISERKDSKYINYSIIALMLYLVTHPQGSALFSPSPDLVVSILEVIIFTLLIDSIFNMKLYKNSFEIYLLPLMLCVYLFSVKLTGLAFSFSTACIVAIYYYKNLAKFNITNLKFFFVFLFFGIFHIINGYILTGYPFFPSSIAGLHNLPWTLHPEIGEKLMWVIYNGTRDPSQLVDHKIFVSSLNWISLWLHNQGPHVLSYIFVSIFLVFLNLIYFFKYPFNKNKFINALIIIAPPIFALVFWFFSAPDIRYLGASFELFLISLWFLFVNGFPRNRLKIKLAFERLKLAEYSLIIIFVFSLASFHSALISKESDVFLHPLLAKKESASGVKLNIPEGLCWDSPLPCVESYNSKLILIEPGKISSGFMTTDRIK